MNEVTDSDGGGNKVLPQGSVLERESEELRRPGGSQSRAAEPDEVVQHLVRRPPGCLPGELFWYETWEHPGRGAWDRVLWASLLKITLQPGPRPLCAVVMTPQPWPHYDPDCGTSVACLL